ncbi:MAG TPA: (2Fe-2S)-binding protein [Stellaceae bacterium]|jgi:bacterioferritin-associated ferredoxin|nr:(2Fe-2S)-binding protein [Stellaceae bacterium]
MYICLCHGFTDRQVRCLAATAEGSIARVYGALGVRPQCGKCVPFVREILRGGHAGARGDGLADPSSSA